MSIAPRRYALSVQIDDKQTLRALRESAGLSHAELAGRLGIDRSYYSRMERGERPVDVDLVARVAALAGARVVVVRVDEDRLLADLGSLSPDDLALAGDVLRLLPHLHPLRREDLRTLLSNWTRSSPSKGDELGAPIVKKM